MAGILIFNGRIEECCAKLLMIECGMSDVAVPVVVGHLEEIVLNLQVSSHSII